MTSDKQAEMLRKWFEVQDNVIELRPEMEMKEEKKQTPWWIIPMLVGFVVGLIMRIG